MKDNMTEEESGFRTRSGFIDQTFKRRMIVEKMLPVEMKECYIHGSGEGI